MNEILKIAGTGLFVCVLAYIFKELKKEYAPIILIAGGLLLTVWGLAQVFPFIEYLSEITQTSGLSEYFNIIIKILGISFLVQIGSDICRQFGEEAIAKRIEFAGKAVILACILPVLKSVVNMGFDLLR